MTQAALAAIAIEIDRLRMRLARGEVTRAAVIVLVDDKVYLSLKAVSEEDAKQYLGTGLLKAMEQGGLVTAEEIEKL